MRPVLITAALLSAALALTACRNHKPQPIPGPRSQVALDLTGHVRAHEALQHEHVHMGRPASEISWFQGTLEEAFARPALKSTHGQCPQRYNSPRLGL